MIELIEQQRLENLQQNVSFIIFYFVLNKNYNLQYISETTLGGLEVGNHYWTPEYFLIRALFFATAESNNSNPITLRQISNDLGFSITEYLSSGISFIENYEILNDYIDALKINRAQDSVLNVLKTAQKILEQYKKFYLLYKNLNLIFVLQK